MKNNELLLSVKFEDENSEDLTLLIDKDLPLKALLEAIYYGLKKLNTENAVNPLFRLFDQYVRTHSEIIFFYRAKKELSVVDVRENLSKKMHELGIVTTTCLVIPNAKQESIRLEALFPEYNMAALCDQRRLEYNISTRRIAVAEPSVIDILPAGELPGGQARNLFDVIIPTGISMAALAGSRALMALFNDNATGFSMIAMMMTTSIATMVTQSYNYFKQGKDNVKTVDEWKTNYEKYLSRVWERILKWQKSDINYLCTTYPSVSELFKRTQKLDRAIFARSQKDLDFFKISLGASENVAPMFEIKNEKKDEIISDIGFIIHKDPEFITTEKKQGKKGYSNGQGTGSEDGYKQYVEVVIPSERLPKRRRNLAGRITPTGQLSDLSDYLANTQFKYLQASQTDRLPPLVIDLKNCGALGIIEPTKKDESASQTKPAPYYSAQFVEHIVFELAYYHTPEDLQFVFFFEKEPDKRKQAEIIRNYKNLPHTNELFEDASQFVFDESSAAIVFGKLQAIMGERTIQASKEEEEREIEQYTQIVCIVFDDYNIKETGFSKYLPTPPAEGEDYVNTNGLTFIFSRTHLAQLPRYCGNIIEIVGSTDADAKVSSRYNVLTREKLNSLSNDSGSGKSKDGKEIKTNTTDDLEDLIDYKLFKNGDIFYTGDAPAVREKKRAYETAFRQLSAIYYRRIAENGNVPSMVTLFEMYDYTTEKLEKGEIRKDILKKWQESDVTHDLSVHIGKNEHGIVDLDLYEKADGPHMLVAGTTGSGKSETIITYLIGLCMKYSPTYLNLMLVDMKGGGFSERLHALPHCVGVVDDTAGESEGVSAVYMLKRFLEVLNAEIKRRKILLKSFGVDNVDDYIKGERIISRILSGKGTPDDEQALTPKELEQLKKLKEENKLPQTLSHLVLVVDEFTELKRFSSESDDIDFIAEITTIARVGRTLGFHIILVSQNIEGAITDDIRINSKSRICLKVATRAASKEMLDGRTDAASPTMPGNGRAYLLVGTGSKYVYFQSAYTGANKDENIEPVVKVTRVEPCGTYQTGFYCSTKDNARIRAAKKANKHDTQLKYIVQLIENIKAENETQKYFRIPREIFKQPLGSNVPDPTEWR